MSSGSTWKGYERRLAAFFGTKRIPAAAIPGEEQKDKPDFETALLAAQAKKGYAFPGYLTAWLDGICQAAGRCQPPKIGFVVWSAKGVRDLDSLVCLRLEDFLRLVSLVEAHGASSGTPCSDTSSGRPYSQPSVRVGKPAA